MRKFLGKLIAATVVTMSGVYPSTAQVPASRELVLHPNQAGPVISRDIFGQFAEHLGEGIYDGVWVGKNSSIPNVRGIRSDVVAALRALKVPNLDPNAAAPVAIRSDGSAIASATGRMLTAPRFDTINSFSQPNAVSPKPFYAAAKDGKIVFMLPPKSVTVVQLTP